MISNNNSTSQGKSRGKFTVVIVVIAALAVLGLLLSQMDGKIAIVVPSAITSTNTPILSATPLSAANTSTATSMPTLTLAPISTLIPASTPTLHKGIQNLANGHWYLVFYQTTWDNAKNYCGARGGHLVTIDDNEENMFVYNLAPYAILGATDKEREGHWIWVTGQEMGYTNWCQGEPNNCGHLELYGYCVPENHLTFHDVPQCNSGQWNDIPAGNGEGTYVCEFEN